MTGSGKRILLIPSWYPDSIHPTKGIFVRKHALMLSEHHNVTVFSVIFDVNGTKGFYSLKEKQENDRLKLLELHIRPLHFPGSAILKHKLINFFFLNWIVFKRKIRYDVVNLNVAYHMGIFLFPFLILTGKPLVITEHWTGYFDQDGSYRKLNFLFRFMIRKLFSRAHRVVAISESLKNRLDELFDCGEKTSVVPNVLNCPRSFRPVTNLDPNHFAFLAVSNFDDRQKGLSGILEAFSGVLTRFPNARLVMAGGGDDFKPVTAHADKLGLTREQVKFPGNIPNERVAELYTQAHGYVMFSNFETFSISTAEALLNGLPVIATRCNGPEEYVTSQNGILVEPGDKQALLNAMISMVENFNSYDPETISGEMKKKYCEGVPEKLAVSITK